LPLLPKEWEQERARATGLYRRMALRVHIRTLWFVPIGLPSVSSRCIVATSARTRWTAFERGNCGADPVYAVSLQL
jgi:hypothetical protein